MDAPRDAILVRLTPALGALGVFTTARAAELGVDHPALTRLARAGIVERLYRGVWRCTLFEHSWEARAKAGLLAAGPHAALGRWSAARVLGLVRPRGAEGVDLVVPRGRYRRVGGPTIRTSDRLRPDDLTEAGGLRCGTVPWTLGELAAVATPGALERIAARAIAEERCTEEELTALAERLRDVPGVVALRGLLSAAAQVVVGARSRAEARAVNLLVAAGLPRPVVNLPVRDAAGRVRVLDLAWPDLGVCIEIDVHPAHGTTLGRRLDGRRQNDLVGTWTVLRFDEQDLEHRPDVVVEQTRRALRAAGWVPETA